MKKLYFIFCLVLLFATCQSASAFEKLATIEVEPETAQHTQQTETLSATVTFDWLDITQAQREDIINNYKNILFHSGNSVLITKDDFDNKFKNYKEDKEYKHHYMLVNNGVTEDNEANYCAFYYKHNTLVMYAIQYKANPKNAFYYSGFGRLYYTDVMSDNYPNFPYFSMQYDHKGNLKSAIYFISSDLQYMFDANKDFQGVWYKDKMYDKNGKQTLTRTNW